ncbi:hypothetical protein [Rugamonas sp. DEMB1]|uniref:hypothetical protein n=1 Tax=Rugamonas sp. DEMB1 TaxID=3039386 RepID=UPI0024490F03|nr:hypothetical protein [Rugamonas sp. DEMB1]WGG52796.1 hypothetical protein QC826_12010 [Rugamonas sp. DEMB1]
MFKQLTTRMRLLFATGLLAVLLVAFGAVGLIVLAGGVEVGAGVRIACLAAVAVGVLLSIAAGLLLQRTIVRPLEQALRQAGGARGERADAEARRLRASLDDMNHSLARIGHLVGAINEIDIPAAAPGGYAAPEAGATVLAMDTARARRRSRAQAAAGCADADADVADATARMPRRHDADAARRDT